MRSVDMIFGRRDLLGRHNEREREREGSLTERVYSVVSLISNV
jgi:hypothetical protein